ncbi:GNAT family N-acetyltransferase [Aureimonas sp. SK2]|uniref:GNAT family N-acetyltransferase n=1 Tax=Aureimonas sp. SK2 TaxID=3015992 RepID=UPI002443B573|nr:GNAT family N-acetyltransferase [Aureimonas sp. SK2]
MKAPEAADWRRMEPGDVPALMALSAIVHPDFYEGEAMFRDRLALFPEGSLVLPLTDGSLAAYAIAYPVRRFAPPPLDTVLGRLPADADALYIHDVAVASEWRGRKLAEPAVERLLALAEPLGATVLVSVYGTPPFWMRFGFRPVDDPALRDKLASYGEEAVFMLRETPGAVEKRGPH